MICRKPFLTCEAPISSVPPGSSMKTCLSLLVRLSSSPPKLTVDFSFPQPLWTFPSCSAMYLVAYMCHQITRKQERNSVNQTRERKVDLDLLGEEEWMRREKILSFAMRHHQRTDENMGILHCPNFLMNNPSTPSKHYWNPKSTPSFLGHSKWSQSQQKHITVVENWLAQCSREERKSIVGEITETESTNLAKHSS